MLPHSQTLGIIGVRDLRGVLYTNTSYVCDLLSDHVKERGFNLRELNIVTGGGKGVERMVMQWADAVRIPYRTIPPNLKDLEAKEAFILRNKQIVFQSTELVVFWDGCTDVVVDSLTTATYAGRRTTIFPLE